MGQLVDVLDKKIKELKDLRQREERRDNKAAQDAIDKKYSELTKKIHGILGALQYTKKNLSFQLNDKILDELNFLLLEHKAAINDGYADKEKVYKVEDDLSSILTEIKREWSKHYNGLTKETISTLKVIAGVDSIKISTCLEGIIKGENWTTEIDSFMSLKNNLDDASKLITGLGLDDEIILFLQKMNKGKATVANLDEKVICWLKKEQLDKKVKLSFNAANIRI